MDRQTAIIRTFGTRDKRRHKRVVNIVVALTRRQGIHWRQSVIAKYVSNRNQRYIRSRRNVKNARFFLNGVEAKVGALIPVEVAA